MHGNHAQATDRRIVLVIGITPSAGGATVIKALQDVGGTITTEILDDTAAATILRPVSVPSFIKEGLVVEAPDIELYQPVKKRGRYWESDFNRRFKRR